jgi:hypothetical protein
VLDPRKDAQDAAERAAGLRAEAEALAHVDPARAEVLWQCARAWDDYAQATLRDLEALRSRLSSTPR